MSINMAATSIVSSLGTLFHKNGNEHTHTNGLSGRSEEPEATKSEQTIRVAESGGASAVQKPVVTPDQTQKATRLRYTREEKLRILRLVDACKERGQVGALLRGEGIYYSTLRDFEKQRAQGRLGSGYEKSKQADTAEQATDKKRIAELEAQNRRLQHKLDQAQIVIDIQKKLSQLLGITLPQTQASQPTDD